VTVHQGHTRRSGESRQEQSFPSFHPVGTLAMSTEDAGCGGVGLVSKKLKVIVGLRVTRVTVGFLFLSTLLEEDRIRFAIPSRPTSPYRYSRACRRKMREGRRPLDQSGYLGLWSTAVRFQGQVCTASFPLPVPPLLEQAGGPKTARYASSH
jgi:hypothetical protein